MIHPKAKAILDVLAELDENTLRDCYGIERTDPDGRNPSTSDAAPLDAAIYAWIDAGRPIEETNQ